MQGLLGVCLLLLVEGYLVVELLEQELGVV